MEHIKQSFARAKHESRAALGAYVTAGYPTVQETPDILLSLESGGAGEYLSIHYDEYVFIYHLTLYK